MFTLRETHNQAFQAKAEADFVREVMQYLRENHAETVVKLPTGEFKVIDLPEETLQKMVEGGIAKARFYKIFERKDLTRFVRLMFLVNPNFCEHKSVKSLFSAKHILPSYYVSALLAAFNDDLLNQIKKDYEQIVWIV
jgi:hypothetical protein